jgi:hypothetical protein
VVLRQALIGGRWSASPSFIGEAEEDGPELRKARKRTSRSWASFRRMELIGGGLQRWLDDGDWRRQGSSVAEGNGSVKGIFPPGRPPLIAAQGGLAAATMGAAKRWWPQSEGRRRGWAPLFGQGHQPMGTARFHYFLNYPKLVETCTIKMDALSCPKNSQCFHGARSEYFEQLSQLF